jgi:hypothetical protein
VRSGYVAAKSIDIGPPSETPMSAALFEPTASRIARTSSIRSSSVPTRVRSERPMPRLSNTIRRENDARRSTKRRYSAISHNTSRFVIAPAMCTRSSGPSPMTRYAMWIPSLSAY